MKGKKILAGLMSAAMVLSTMSFTVFAANPVLKDLIASRTDNTITLTADTDWTEDINVSGEDLTIDLDGKTLEIKRRDMYVRSNVTFRNGSITMNGIQSWQSSLIAYNDATNVTLTFEGIDFTADGCGGGAAIIEANKNGTINTKAYGDKKTVIRVTNTAYDNGNIIQREPNANTINLEDTEIYGDNVYGGLCNIASIKNCKIELTNVKGYGIAATTTDTTINNSSITVDGCKTGAKFYNGCDKSINLTNGSSFTVENSSKGDIFLESGANNGVTYDETSTVSATVANEPHGFVVGGYAVISTDRIYGDVTALINKSLKVELWTVTECIATTELKDGDYGYGDMIDGTERTVTFGFNYDADSDLGSDYWTGNYFNPTIEKRPVKVVVYIDGDKICEGGVSTPTQTGYPDYDYKWNEVPVVYAPAKIGTVGYVSLGAALAAAVDGDTITMYEDATEVQENFQYLHPGYNFTYAGTLDLNGHTLVLNGYDYKISAAQSGKNFTFTSSAETSGVIKITTESIPGTGIFWIFGNQTIKFENVTINAKNFSSTGYAGWAVVDLEGANSNAEFVNSTLNVGSDDMISLSYAISCNGTNQNVVFDNSVLDVKNIKGQAIGNGIVTVKGDNSEIKVDNAAFGMYLGTATSSLTVTDNAHINITNIFGDDEYNPEKAGIVLGATNPYSFEKPENINATIYRTPTEENLADTVKLSFEDVTAEDAEGEKVYDLYIESDTSETINRLMSAQMAFELTTEDAFKYKVTAADGLTLTEDNGVYLFNFDGETAPSATSPKIKIGQVKFTGYGTFTFKATEGQAHATTINDNIVTDYVVDPSAETEGKFDIDATLEDIEVAVPTRKLTINIDFNNAVENQVAAYQDMTVTVKGKDYDESFKLGSDADAVAIAENKATIEIAEKLVYNTPYTVEVSGAGYRTTGYTVTMNADKTLNFWNNAKDTATAVETGKDASAKKVTFLAGELVDDGIINIYDLSAVVSYFGTINDVTATSDYAKYDLNRDGKIDSKDVAYVLVSWGK